MSKMLRGFILKHLLLLAAICFECTSSYSDSTSTTNAPVPLAPAGGSGLMGGITGTTTTSFSISPGSGGARGSGGFSGGGMGAPSSPNCTAVSYLLQARGLKSADIPTDPTKETIHRFCEMPSTGSCCTYKMETHLAAHTKEIFVKTTKELIGKLSNVLGTRAQKLNDYFLELLEESKKEFHIMFKRTYGNIYEQNSYVFANFFTELLNYFTRGKVDLAVAMDSFFNVLYQKMFTVLNSHYMLDDKYLGCVSEHMKDLKPFGDVPDKLSVQVKRSFVATRTFAQALSAAADLAKVLMNVRINTDCNGALTKMQQCNLCQGHPEKPCARYCVNVMKGCLQHYISLDAEWDNFVSFMEKVAERLLGPFNIVMVVEPINIKISEAIMNFQEMGQSISEQVFKGCGEPDLGQAAPLTDRIKKSASSAAPQYGNGGGGGGSNSGIIIGDDSMETAIMHLNRTRRSARDRQQSDDYESSTTYNSQADQVQRTPRRKNKKKQYSNKKDFVEDSHEPSLDKIIKDIRQRVKETKKFWSNLVYQLCNSGDLASVQPTTNQSCWNGHEVVRHEDLTTHDSTMSGHDGGGGGISQIAQQKNMVSSQLYYLKTAISNLRNAYNGLDVEWSDQEEPFESSGFGSGDGMDDDDEIGSGSPGGGGGGSFDEMAPKQPKMPSIHVGTTSTGTGNTAGPKDSGSETTYTKDSKGGIDGNSIDGSSSSSGSGSTRSSSPQVPRMSLRRALIMYLFPIYMAWFGGIITDLL